MDRYLVVLAGAGLGGLGRYAAGVWITQKYAGRFPLGTFMINVTGAFLIGLLMTLFAELQPHPNWRLFLVTGVLGGYTTFSTYEYESFQAFRTGGQWVGLSYLVGTVVLGYIGVWLGTMLAGAVRH